MCFIPNVKFAVFQWCFPLMKDFLVNSLGPLSGCYGLFLLRNSIVFHLYKIIF